MSEWPQCWGGLHRRRRIDKMTLESIRRIMRDYAYSSSDSDSDTGSSDRDSDSDSYSDVFTKLLDLTDEISKFIPDNNYKVLVETIRDARNEYKSSHQKRFCTDLDEEEIDELISNFKSMMGRVIKELE